MNAGSALREPLYTGGSVMSMERALDPSGNRGPGARTGMQDKASMVHSWDVTRELRVSRSLRRAGSSWA